jgi:hypothetical protein
MMRIFSLGFACLALASCETGTYCTEEFRSVGFTWTTPPLPARVITVNARTGDTLSVLDQGYENFFAVADDGNMPDLRREGDSLSVTVLDSLGSVRTTAWYVVGRDDCHIQLISGPEFLP